jgi:hypothetical protein
MRMEKREEVSPLVGQHSTTSAHFLPRASASARLCDALFLNLAGMLIVMLPLIEPKIHFIFHLSVSIEKKCIVFFIKFLTLFKIIMAHNLPLSTKSQHYVTTTTCILLTFKYCNYE